jgi:hypothetical protein
MADSATAAANRNHIVGGNKMVGSKNPSPEFPGWGR